MRELEIYIHIPFCVKKCAYCDFLSAPATRGIQNEYVKALENEIRAFSGAGDYQVRSIFFGGGTPSILEAGKIEEVLNTLKNCFQIQEDAEISIECNPGTASFEKMLCYRQAGINRISFGLQSARNEELIRLGRIHTFEDFLKTYKDARKAGFDNINIDLMSGLPGQTVESWEQTVRQVLALKLEHLSAYGLIIEEGTPFFDLYEDDVNRREKGEEPLELPTEEAEREMYHRTRILLEEAGLMRYEISNYALPGKECRHNLGYWTGVEYIGFGLGASSLLAGRRIKNTVVLEQYLMQEYERQTEVLSEEDQEAEFMFLGLRTIRGVSKKEFQDKFNRTMEETYGSVLERFLNLKLLKEEGDRISLTEAGIDVSNYIMSEFV